MMSIHNASSDALGCCNLISEFNVPIGTSVGAISMLPSINVLSLIDIPVSIRVCAQAVLQSEYSNPLYLSPL